MLKVVGYLGPEGTFSHVAAELFVKEHSHNFSLQSFGSFNALFDAFFVQKIDYFMLPIENSIGGSVITSNDLLVGMVNGSIVREIVVSVELSIMTKLLIAREDITIILSHPQPLLQCDRYLKKYFPLAKTRSCASTSEAAKEVSESEKAFAVIGNERVLKDKYQLKVIDSKVQDEGNNQTRFVVIGRENVDMTKNDKTSIIFSAERERPGSLYDILKVFAVNSVNLTRIESRPTRKLLGEYLFFIDFDGHYNDLVISTVLKQVKEMTSFFKCLGSYPKCVAHDRS